MRKSRFTDEQIVAILREAERTSVAETAKKKKVSEQTIYSWRSHFNGLQPQDICCLPVYLTGSRSRYFVMEGERSFG